MGKEVVTTDICQVVFQLLQVSIYYCVLLWKYDTKTVFIDFNKRKAARKSVTQTFLWPQILMHGSVDKCAKVQCLSVASQIKPVS